MSRVYTVSFEAVNITAGQDLLAIVAGTNRTCRILGAFLSQTGVGDVGDAAEEILSIRFRSGQTTVGSGGTAFTPAALAGGVAAAATFTSRINDTTQATAGTILVHHVDAWNVRLPYQIWFPEKAQIVVTGARRATFELPTAPADQLNTCRACLYVEET